MKNLKEQYREKYGDRQCICCKDNAWDNCYSAQGFKEVLISGVCEKCFDKMFAEEEE